MNHRIVIRLGVPRRYRLERLRKKSQDPDLRTRISIVLLFDKGYRSPHIAEVVGRAPATVVRVAHRYLDHGEEGLMDGRRENGQAKVDADLLQALALLRDNMPVVNCRPGDGDARLNLCAAAFLSNRASDSGGGGGAMSVVSALAHSLDTRYRDCSHGAAYSILTAPGMRFNLDYNTDGQARLATILGVREKAMDQRQAARAAADAVAETFRELGMPARLSDVGVTEDGIESIAEDAMTDFGLHRNVRPVKGVAELKSLLRDIW